ncbi:hypothetical protein HMPREF1977_0474 [Capnocytophaga ochracea F0287]|uniref:Uncharacterized protein n=1 Tax=Capnocytophaga ochracea F0287 TaxID=873517 RepID=E4MQ14_CAPOC|nr:hypothetical protein HMPREF1977_0474 [Capnocytophaga ochracea F0287]EJF44419.1 hypothetical protein HMPREF1319_0812 [Capnocytophaga ochracea str. Holt 25]
MKNVYFSIYLCSSHIFVSPHSPFKKITSFSYFRFSSTLNPFKSLFSTHS